MNKIQRTILARRVAGIIANQLDWTVYLKDDTITLAGDKKRVSVEEAAKHVIINNKAVADFYRNYKVPEWFVPFLKQRCLKSVSIKGKWNTLGRRVTSTSKVTSEEKIRAFTRPDTARLYFTSNRVLDSKREGHGEGHPIKDLIYPVLDIDADDDHEHSIKPNGQMCITCEMEARSKLRKVIRALEEIGYNEPRVIPSGNKGFHVHVTDHEVSEKEYLRILDYVNNQTEGAVDDFSFVEDGVRHWDSHRVWRMPGSVDAGSLTILKDHKQTTASQVYYYDEFTMLKTNDTLKKPPQHDYKPGDLVIIKRSNVKDPFMSRETAIKEITKIESITPGNYIVLENIGTYRPEWVRKPTKKELAIYGARTL